MQIQLCPGIKFHFITVQITSNLTLARERAVYACECSNIVRERKLSTRASAHTRTHTCACVRAFILVLVHAHALEPPHLVSSASACVRQAMPGHIHTYEP